MATSTSSGFVELATRIAQGIGVSAQSLLDDSATPQAVGLGHVKFKGEARLNDRQDVVVGICKRAAELAIFATGETTCDLVGKSPELIRNEILADGDPWVDVTNLANYCWKHGVPVLPVSKFPTGVNKPDGMLISVDGRPVIIVSKNQKQPAWLLFILAHELGHILAGHLSDNGLIVDRRVSDDIDEDDDEERQADRNAIAVLTGSPSRSYRGNGRVPNAEKLAKLSEDTGSRDGVYPGHIVLNYIHGLSGSFHGLGNATLNKLYPKANSPASLRKCMSNHLDFSKLPEDNAEFLLRVAGVDGPST